MLLFLYVTEEAGRKCVRGMPWPLAAECNMITNKQTIAGVTAQAGTKILGNKVGRFGWC